VEARVVYKDHTTKYFSFGHWSGAKLTGMRWSVGNQRDADGTVLTDTLWKDRPGGLLQLRLTGRMLASSRPAKLRRIYVNFFSPSPSEAAAAPSESPAWGIVMDPPQMAQGYFPGGKGLCSPTAVAMVLNYWAARTGQKSLRVTVPEVECSVYDLVYKGAGNWSFNTSFAGSQSGLTGFAARLNSMADLEAWIAAGVPVICSVSWYLLHGEQLQPDENGHLVVLVGFMPNGDPVFNDPGDRTQVRKVYRRADFIRAWEHSERTGYFILPQKLMPEWAVVQVPA
jgi:hypothetical protein